MSIVFDGRPTDSPLVDMVWYSRTEGSGTFISTAETRSEIVFAKMESETFVTIRGPETVATVADWTTDTEFFGIAFKLGTFMPHLPPRKLMNRKDLILPVAGDKSFWLKGSAWEFPNYENVETFVEWLIRDGLLVHDPVVDAVLQDQQPDMSLRTVQRRFVQATGLTYKDIQQIERAKQATTLLEQGASILDTVYETGYFDQPHLTKSLKRYQGKTPAEILGLKPSA
jgi:AraC-like DNA-binding protein